MWAAIGLCEEAGEAGGVLKKANYYRKNREDRLKVNPEKFLEEHGDTLHYLMTSLKLNGFTLEDAARANLEKMAIRFKDGWNPEDAINRRDKGEKDE
jgi:NTP pyrophosphatase (non-canonical NTP hydrolase)